MSRPREAPLEPAPAAAGWARARGGLRPAVAGLAAMLALFGFLFVVQARTVGRLRPSPDVPSRRVEELALLIRRQQEARDRLADEATALSKQVRSYQTALAERRGLAEQMRRDIRHYRLVLGLARLEGPGIVVTLSERAPAGGAPPVSLVQAQDLSALANELWSAGAEAVAINGIRVLASTAYRDANGRIGIRGRVLRPPYTIAAIGDPQALEGVLRIRGGFAEGLASVGIDLRIARKGLIGVPALDRTIRFRRAAPVRP